MHYLYNQTTQRQTVIRRDFSCPICSMFCGCLDGLLMHFTCSHSRFRFRLTEDSRGHPHIHVHVCQPAKLAGPAVSVNEVITASGAGSACVSGGSSQGSGKGSGGAQGTVARTGQRDDDDGPGSGSESDTAQTQPFMFFRARRTAAPTPSHAAWAADLACR